MTRVEDVVRKIGGRSSEERALPSMRFPEASAAVAQSHRRADRLPDVHRFLPHLGEERALPSLRFPDHSSGISAARNTRKARKLCALKVGRLRRGRSPFLFNFKSSIFKI